MSTNQGSVLAFTLDMPSAKHRDSRSPIIMPVGELGRTHYRDIEEDREWGALRKMEGKGERSKGKKRIMQQHYYIVSDHTLYYSH